MLEEPLRQFAAVPSPRSTRLTFADPTREPSVGMGRRPGSAEVAQDATSHEEQFFATDLQTPLPPELMQWRARWRAADEVDLRAMLRLVRGALPSAAPASCEYTARKREGRGEVNIKGDKRKRRRVCGRRGRVRTA